MESVFGVGCRWWSVVVVVVVRNPALVLRTMPRHNHPALHDMNVNKTES